MSLPLVLVKVVYKSKELIDSAIFNREEEGKAAKLILDYQLFGMGFICTRLLKRRGNSFFS